jgi:hypothetical protein
MSGAFPSQADGGATILVEKLKPRVLPLAGEVFGGYSIERELGRGGMGAVYAAEHRESGRRVALKVLSHQLDSADARARFLREGRLAASINHPNSVYVFGTEEIEGTPVISMELIAGGTLQDRIQREGPFAVGTAVDATLQIIAGLEAAHAVGILHRDVKPANCFTDLDGSVKVGDFGLSISTAARGESHLTLPGDFLGTPAFCSPEQLRGDELNLRSDMYSVGVTLFYLLTGRTPFEGKNMVQLLANVLEKSAPSPTQLRAEIPQALSAVVLRCLNKQAGDRFGSYEELRRALAPFGSAAPAPAPLGLRFGAYVVDWLLLSTVNWMVLYWCLRGVMNLADPQSLRSPQAFWSIVGVLMMQLLYFGILEGIWGASAGKALAGLRVTGLNRSAPGIPRALARMSLLSWPALPHLLAFKYDPAGTHTHIVGFTATALLVVNLLVLFFTARRRNGLAAVHDLLTGTRVIQKPAPQSREVVSPSETPIPATDAMPKLGPYHVLSELSTDGDDSISLGYDTRLLRQVWIRQTHAGEPAVPHSQRNLARPGRLRWLQGVREANESWDAYEAADGSPLVNLLEAPQPWRIVRHWLLDLAVELKAAAEDGTVPEMLAMDRVWITSSGRAKLLDFAGPGVAHATQPTKAGVPAGIFLNQIAISALEGRIASVEEAMTRAVAAPLPIEARNLMREFKAATNLPAIVEKLRPLMQRVAEISAWRRFALLFGCALPAVFLGAFMVLFVRHAQDFLVENPRLTDLKECLVIYASMNDVLKDEGMEKVPLPEARAAMEVYISHEFDDLIRNPKLWANSMLMGMIRQGERAAGEKIIANHPRPTEQEFAKAQATIRPLLAGRTAERIEIQRRVERQRTVAAQAPMIVNLVLFLILMPVAVLSLLWAVAFRGGLLLWLLGIAVVRGDGADASRLRLLGRGLVAWSPVLVSLLLVQFFKIHDSYAAVALMALICGLAIASLVSSGRSLQDRFAGTWLVPR